MLNVDFPTLDLQFTLPATPTEVYKPLLDSVDAKVPLHVCIVWEGNHSTYKLSVLESLRAGEVNEFAGRPRQTK